MFSNYILPHMRNQSTRCWHHGGEEFSWQGCAQRRYRMLNSLSRKNGFTTNWAETDLPAIGKALISFLRGVSLWTYQLVLELWAHVRKWPSFAPHWVLSTATPWWFGLAGPESYRGGLEHFSSSGLAAGRAQCPYPHFLLLRKSLP